jgi:hypothetical protein
MKTLLTSVIILLFITSFSFAQVGIHNQRKHEGSRARMIDVGMRPMIYRENLITFMTKASSLELTNNQEKELANIMADYVYQLIRKEAENKVLHMKVMSM